MSNVNGQVELDIVVVQATPDVWRHMEQWQREPIREVLGDEKVMSPVTCRHRHANFNVEGSGMFNQIQCPVLA